LSAAVPEFEANLGQAAAQYVYLARAGNTRVLVQDRGIEFVSSPGSAIRLLWDAAETARGEWSTSEPANHTNYYCNQPKRELCANGIPTYHRLLRRDLYPGVDWALYGKGSDLEYDLIVHPDAARRNPRLRVEGAEASVGADGRLHAGPVLHWRPEAYQMVDGHRVTVESSIRPTGGGEFEVVLGAHREDLDLIVDPVIQTIAVSGGSNDDAIVGSMSSNYCSFVYGTTRSGDWSNLGASTGKDIFVQSTGSQRTTIFWGGEGDEEIGGADADLNNCRIYVVGWTNSRNAPVVPYAYGNSVTHPFAGGATDGFFLQVGRSLEFATYVGGPGADKLYDVRRTAPSGSTGPFAVVGETDDAGWPNTTVRKIGPGGKTDAIAGLINGAEITMTVIGGSGNDRAMRLRSGDAGYWTIAGESDSPDFPARDGAQAAAGLDVWAGRIRGDFSDTAALRLFGGAGDEHLGGVAFTPAVGLYLAGTTTSTDLPSAGGTYQGGSSDGFLAVLDPVTAATLSSTYIGGSGRDEINALDSSNGDLMLGGATDSTDLTLPGLNSGDAVTGGLDALFVLCDSLGTPSRGIRMGGAGDDRVLGVEASPDLGKVYLSGVSSSQDWLATLDPYSTGLGGQDGFTVSVNFSQVKVGSSIASLYLGRDLQVWLPIYATSEPGLDGIVTVRSTDPSKLLVSASQTQAGTDQILIRNVDQGNYNQSFVLQALSGSGQVDVVIEGRMPPSATGFYPRRHLRVNLAPTEVFLAPGTTDTSIAVNNQTGVSFIQAPVLPDGTAGPAEDYRYGVTATVDAVSSDNSGLSVIHGALSGSNVGQFSVGARAIKEGTYTLTPMSSQFPTAPGQTRTIRVTATQPRIFFDKPYVLAKDFYARVDFTVAAGDSLRFTTDDPSLVSIGSNQAAGGSSVSYTFPAAGTGSLWYMGGASSGTTTVHVTGTLQGTPISENMLVQLVGYQVTMSRVPSTVGTGQRFFIQSTIAPLTAGYDQLANIVVNGAPKAAVLATQIRTSNPSVVQILSQSQGFQGTNYTLIGVNPGTAMLDFGASPPEAFASFQAQVQVVPARIDFGTSVIRIPAGTEIYLGIAYSTTYASTDALSAVRFRLNSGAPLTLDTGVNTGTDLTSNMLAYTIGVSAANASAGQVATLFVSAPGIPEYSIPIRIVDPLLLPTTGEVRLGPQVTTLSYQMAAYDGGQTYPINAQTLVRKKLTVRPTFNPAGICSVPATIDVAFYVNVPVTCSAAGATVLTLQPDAGIASVQSQYTVRVVSQPVVPPSSLSGLTTRILTGNGLQSPFYPYLPNGAFTGKLASTEPDRLKLSLDPKAVGSASVTITAQTINNGVWMQGYDSSGVVKVKAQATDGSTADISVYLFPATMAVRPASNTSFPSDDLSSQITLNQPYSSKDFTLSVRPYLVDMTSGKVLWTSGLAIRGGADPFFVQAQSTDATVVQPVPPDALMDQAIGDTRLSFRVAGNGDVLLSASQPDSFVTVPDASLKVHVFERELGFNVPTLLSPDMQMPAQVVPLNDSSTQTTVTITSLDPSKLVISTEAMAAGTESATAPMGQTVYLQALSGAQPGDSVRVRLQAAGYATSERTVPIAAAELQLLSTQVPIPIQPGANSSLNLVYGPITETGTISSTFGGTMRAGVTVPLQLSTSDTNIISLPQQTVLLDHSVTIPLRGVAPGRAQLQVQAPPGVTNRAATVDIAVQPFQFFGASLDSPSRHLVSKAMLTNPRAQQTVVTLKSSGYTPVALGTSNSGAGLPSAGTLTLTLPPNGSQTFYLEPLGSGGTSESAKITMSATDFTDNDTFVSFSEPKVSFSQGGSLSASLSSGTLQMPILLTDQYQGKELPLGTSFGPLKIQLQTSNAQVVQVPSAPVQFDSGDSRKTVTFQLTGRGDAVVSLIVPAGFNSTTSTRQDLVVSVR
jgi:hypothetical protein